MSGKKGKNFSKYLERGPGYHWHQNSRHPVRMSAFVKARYKKCLGLLEGELGSLKDKRILDAGCGDGVLTYEIFKKGAKAFGVDTSKEALDFAEKKLFSLKARAEFRLESCTNTSFGEDCFDAVVSSDVIEHLEDPRELLQEIKRILKDKGIALISTPVRFTGPPMDEQHVNEWFPEEFKKLVCESFPDSQFFFSHPLFWYEFMNFSGKARLLLNLMSYFKNSFLSGSGKWRLFAIQYAVCRKSS